MSKTKRDYYEILGVTKSDTEAEVKKAEEARDELKAAVEANDLETMKTKRDELNEIVQALTVKLYEQAAQAQGEANPEGAEQAQDGSDDVVDADFEEVDDENK